MTRCIRPSWFVVAVIGFGLSATLAAEPAEKLTAWWQAEPAQRPAIASLELPGKLSREEANDWATTLWQAYQQGSEAKLLGEQFGPLPPTMAELIANAQDGQVQINARAIKAGEHVMPFTIIRKERDVVPEEGRALFICMHGGGQHNADGPHAWPVNTREWQVQTQLAIMAYDADGLFFVPRMADDRLGRWVHPHNHDAFDRLMRHAAANWGVDLNRVYILGISQGGYGTCGLATFMPDRFAGANAMAAGVGPGSAENLRNLPFRTDIGENDNMFDRAPLARQFHQRLDELHEKDPAGYMHELAEQQGRGHGIDYRPGIPWITQYSRNPFPDRVVWVARALHGRRAPHAYWLELEGELTSDPRIVAQVDREKNTIAITTQASADSAEGEENPQPLKGVTLRVLLHDALVDLDKPVTVMCDGRTVHEGIVHRDASVMLQTLQERGDLAYICPARIQFDL